MKCHGYVRYKDLVSGISYLLFVIVSVYASDTDAIQWDFNPRLTVSETYTDNVRLGAAGLGGGGLFGSNQQGGDFITQINPGVLFTGVGRRFNLSTNYTMNNLIFADNSNLNRIRHQLNANATTEVIKDFFFIDGMARRTQQNATLLGPQAVDNTNVTGNRIDLRVYSVSPYLRYRLKNLATTELRYSRGIVESNRRNGLRNSQRDSYQFNLISGIAFRTLQWGLNYNKNIIHFTRTNREISLERSIANLRYNVTSQFALTGTGGYERNNFGGTTRDISAPSWTAGFAWAPTQRTDLNLAIGKRFFGDTYRGEFKHRRRLTTWSANYVEEVTTFNQQASSAGGFGGFGGGLGSQDGFGGLGTLNALNSANNGLFLQKRFRATVDINGVRNKLSFSIFSLSRKSLSTIDDNIELFGDEATALLARNIKQTGGNARWNYRFSPRTNASLGASFVRFKFASSNTTNNNMIYNARLTRNIQPNLTGIFSYRHIRRQSGSSQFGNLSANSVTASLRMDF